MDYAVSSYTPSLTSLLTPSATPAPRNIPNILVVSQSHTPGQTPLPGTLREAELVRTHFPHGTTLAHAEATITDVLSAMEAHCWVHLACHGIQDPLDPTKSAFALYDGRLELSQLMTKSLKHAELAVLSACQTATGDEKLPEEAVHLAAGMLTVGYKSVVGTMWSIMDADGPTIADAFYATLRENDEVEGRSRTAYALHEAVRQLRDKVGEETFIRWVPFVLLGCSFVSARGGLNAVVAKHMTSV